MRGILLVGWLLLAACSEPDHRYHSARHGFSLELPASMGWQNDYLGSAVVARPQPGSALQGELRYLSIDVNDARELGRGLADYVDFRLSRLQRFARHSEFHQREQRQLAGYPALRLRASAQYGPQHNELLLYYVVAGDRGYALTAAFRPGSSAAAIQQVDQWLSSLRFASH